MFSTRARCFASTRVFDRTRQKSRNRTLLKASFLTTVSVLAVCNFSQAQSVTIDSQIDTPIETATADNGSPADINITEDGGILIAEVDGTVAVTLNSDNNITNNGTIQLEDSDNVVGLSIAANQSGDIGGFGDILLIEDYEREDEDDDEDLDGAYAIGSNRTALLLQSGGVHTGNITLQPDAVFTVEGNDSYGLRLQSALDGTLAIDGTVSVLGDNAHAIHAEQDISGDVLVSGGVSAMGENAQAMTLDGDIGGALTFESLVSSTGFANTSITNYVAPRDIDEDTPGVADRIDAEDLLDNQGAVTVRGSVVNGILINGNVDDFISEEDEEDETKDTIEDFDENRTSGTISSIGSGTALWIYAEDRDLDIGPVVETVRDTLDDDDDDDFTETLATFDYTQGFINRGTINADGLNIGFDASALRIEGAADGSTQVNIASGMLISGTIQATAYDADAIAAAFGIGANIGALANSGLITARTTAVTTESATAFLLEEGANLSTLTNDQGTISANVVGVSGFATAVRDLSGTLTSITNNGTISAVLSDDGTETAETGRSIAIDLSTHDAATGATLIQDWATPVEDTNADEVIDTDDVETPRLIGDVLFGAGDDTFQLLAGSMVGDTDFGSGDADLTIGSGTSYSGNISFDDGAHYVSASNAAIAGDVSFNNSVAQFDLRNGSTFSGRILTDAPTVDMTVSGSDLAFDAANRTTLNSLSVSGESELTFHIDPDDSAGAVLMVAEAATLESDVTFTPILESIARDPFTQVLISAQSVTYDGTFDNFQLSGVPFIYNLNLAQTEQELALEFGPKKNGERPQFRPQSVECI